MPPVEKDTVPSEKQTAPVQEEIKEVKKEEVKPEQIEAVEPDVAIEKEKKPINIKEIK